MQLLYADDLVDIKKEELKSKFKNDFFKDKYLAIVFLGHDAASKIFIKNKIRFGSEVWIDIRVFGQDAILDLNSTIDMIEKLNHDKYCIGIIVQLPLSDHLKMHRREILDSIDIKKDVDMLHTKNLELIRDNKTSLQTATVRWALELLHFYKLDNYKDKKITIIGQSNLIGRPLGWWLKRQWALVQTYDIHSTMEEIIDSCKSSYLIFSATGVPGLIDDRAISGGMQVFVDFGFGMKDEAIYGDVILDNDKYIDDQIYITPVPWWLGKMTVVGLFENLYDMVKGEL